MSVGASNWYEPVAPGAGAVRSIGWWGMLLGAAALLTLQGTLVAAYLYIRWGHTTWPPTGFEAPALLPALAAVPAVAAAVAATWTLLALRGGRGERLFPGLAVTIVLAVLTIALRAGVYAGVDFGWDEHAYASLFWVLGGYELLILAVGVVVAAMVVVQGVAGLADVERNAAVEIAALYWWFAALTSLTSVTTLHLLAYA